MGDWQIYRNANAGPGEATEGVRGPDTQEEWVEVVPAEALVRAEQERDEAQKVVSAVEHFLARTVPSVGDEWTKLGEALHRYRAALSVGTGECDPEDGNPYEPGQPGAPDNRGVCPLCGSGVLSTGEHIRDDLPPCSVGTGDQ